MRSKRSIAKSTTNQSGAEVLALTDSIAASEAAGEKCYGFESHRRETLRIVDAAYNKFNCELLVLPGSCASASSPNNHFVRKGRSSCSRVGVIVGPAQVVRVANESSAQ